MPETISNRFGSVHVDGGTESSQKLKRIAIGAMALDGLT